MSRAAPAGFSHVPVLLEEAMTALEPRSGGLYVDATFGAGGYARALLDRGAKRGVDIETAGAGFERRHRLVKQDGNVAGFGRRGATHRGVSPGASASRSVRNRRTRARASSRCV